MSGHNMRQDSTDGKAADCRVGDLRFESRLLPSDMVRSAANNPGIGEEVGTETQGKCATMFIEVNNQT